MTAEKSNTNPNEYLFVKNHVAAFSSSYWIKWPTWWWMKQLLIKQHKNHKNISKHFLGNIPFRHFLSYFWLPLQMVHIYFSSIFYEHYRFLVSSVIEICHKSRRVVISFPVNGLWFWVAWKGLCLKDLRRQSQNHCQIRFDLPCKIVHSYPLPILLK